MRFNYKSKKFISAIVAVFILGLGLPNIPGLNGALTGVTCGFIECTDGPVVDSDGDGGESDGE